MTTTTTTSIGSSSSSSAGKHTTIGHPVCTSCAYPAEYVYTSYTTRSNIRLAACTECSHFVDPLIEHPRLLIILDLVLLKPRVFLHLLFNRRAVSRHAVGAGRATGDGDGDQELEAVQPPSLPPPPRSHRAVIRSDLALLGLATIAAECAVRLAAAGTVTSGAGDGDKLTATPTWTLTHVARLLAVTAACVSAELVAQHLATLALALAVLWAKGWYPARPSPSPTSRRRRRDGRQESFLPELIPLVLLYTALLPLILELVLSIWYSPPAPAPALYPSSLTLTHSMHDERIPARSTITLVSSLPRPLAAALFSPETIQLLARAESDIAQSLAHAWYAADRDGLGRGRDRAWVWAGTRLLGGMSAGFGLRVLLPTKPWETTAIVLVGWIAAAAVARALNQVSSM